MSYSFHIEGGPGGMFAMNGKEMSIMRELMREVGAVRDPMTVRALSGPTAHPDAPPVARFSGTLGELVLASECAVIAARLREHRSLAHDFSSFFAGDWPTGAALDAWLERWIDFNEHAAAAGGYRVR
ncbi:MAG: hypothetical protein U0234_14970 [Sandaracinus sp.]